MARNLGEALANWWAHNPDESSGNHDDRTSEASFHEWTKLKGNGKTNLSWEEWASEKMKTRDTYNGEHFSKPVKFKDIPSEYNDHNDY